MNVRFVWEQTHFKRCPWRGQNNCTVWTQLLYASAVFAMVDSGLAISLSLVGYMFEHSSQKLLQRCVCARFQSK
jgi:hypothetical protein